MKVIVTVSFPYPIKRLYIPHGSDERSRHTDYLKDRHKLYIPHGSDESREFIEEVTAKMNFISHMVQMKGLTVPHALFAGAPFISHMVQMKDTNTERVESGNFVFISHMVQMKVILLETILCLERSLYPTWFR